MLNIGSAIEKGAKAFLFAEYIYIGVFIVLLALIIFFFIETTWSLWTTGSFVLGAVTSIIAGYIGMRVATYANYRCAY
jgi:inorganic pyrophosphatase